MYERGKFYHNVYRAKFLVPLKLVSLSFRLCPGQSMDVPRMESGREKEKCDF